MPKTASPRFSPFLGLKVVYTAKRSNTDHQLVNIRLPAQDRLPAKDDKLFFSPRLGLLQPVGIFLPSSNQPRRMLLELDRCSRFMDGPPSPFSSDILTLPLFGRREAKHYTCCRMKTSLRPRASWAGSVPLGTHMRRRDI